MLVGGFQGPCGCFAQMTFKCPFTTLGSLENGLAVWEDVTGFGFHYTVSLQLIRRHDAEFYSSLKWCVKKRAGCGCYLFHEISYYSTSYRSKRFFCSQLFFFFCLFFWVTSSYHIHPHSVVFDYSPVVSPGVVFLCSSSPVLPTAYWTALPRCRKLSLSEAELTCLWEWRASLSLQALLSPCPDPRSDWLLQVWFEFSNLVLKVLHVPAVVLLFSVSPLYLGPGCCPRHRTFSLCCSPLLPFLPSWVFFLFHLKCKILFKYYFHCEVFLLFPFSKSLFGQK